VLDARTKNEGVMGALFAFPSLMASTGQEFSMFMPSHFLSSFLYNTAQQITSYLYAFKTKQVCTFTISLFICP